MLIIENPSHTLLAEQSELLIPVREKDALDFIGIAFKSPVGTTVLLDAEHFLSTASDLLRSSFLPGAPVEGTTSPTLGKQAVTTIRECTNDGAPLA